MTAGTDPMPLRSARTLPALCLALLLAGCSKGAEPPAGKAAGAQVLPGSISDAMLDLDQSRARPLLQPPPPTVVTANDAASDAPSDVAAEPAAAVPAPATN
jgi:hypothetical protein